MNTMPERHLNIFQPFHSSILIVIFPADNTEHLMLSLVVLNETTKAQM